MRRAVSYTEGSQVKDCFLSLQLSLYLHRKSPVYPRESYLSVISLKKQLLKTSALQYSTNMLNDDKNIFISSWEEEDGNSPI
jgi:hypothetical protein